MSDVTYFRRLAAHDDWANRTLSEYMRKMANPPARALEIFAHVIGTQWTWLARMKGTAPEMKVWPTVTLDECRGELERLGSAWREFLASVDPSARFAYTNTKAERFENTIADALTHVFLHSHYHRGQIALLIRESGTAPPYTDFIEAVRKRLIR